MLGQKLAKFLWIGLFFISGCSSLFFPDFEDDIVVDDGGKIEVRKVEDKGVLVSDKANALYEDENDEQADNQTSEKEEAPVEVAAASVVPVESEDVEAREEVQDKAIAVQDKTDNNDEKTTPSVRYLAEVIYFNNGGAQIDGDGVAKLKKIAAEIKKNKAVAEIYGFASSRTRNTDPVSHKLANFKVSAQRAENAALFLQRLGIKKDSINWYAMSDSMPVYKEVMPEGERLNRRVEIYLVY